MATRLALAVGAWALGAALALSAPGGAVRAQESASEAGKSLATGRYSCKQEIIVNIGYNNGQWDVTTAPAEGEFLIEVEDVRIEGGGLQQRIRVIDRDNSLIEPNATFWYQDDVKPEAGFDFPADIPHDRQLFSSQNGQLWVYDSPENEGFMLLFSGLLVNGRGAGTLAGLCEYIDFPS